MCGRFVAATEPFRLARYFDAEEWPVEQEKAWVPNYNTAPTQQVLAIRESAGQRRIEYLRWGLVPAWAEDLRIGSRMINARAETVTEKRSFSKPFKTQRCLVPVDGFYEWQVSQETGRKQPHYLFRGDGEPLALAGLWEVWNGGTEGPIETCTILTCAPNQTLAPIHDRMPVVLGRSAWGRWLDNGEHDTGYLQTLLVPAANDLILHHPIDTAVNSASNNHAWLREPVNPDALTTGDNALF